MFSSVDYCCLVEMLLIIKFLQTQINVKFLLDIPDTGSD